jgi:hypothetical protein
MEHYFLGTTTSADTIEYWCRALQMKVQIHTRQGWRHRGRFGNRRFAYAAVPDFGVGQLAGAIPRQTHMASLPGWLQDHLVP